jgi:hypothetical protein
VIASYCFWLMPPTQMLGLYDGAEAIATIRPVLTSMTTAAPESAAYRAPPLFGSPVVRAWCIASASARSAEACTRASMLVTR